jgi:hypothetical protein
MITKSRSMVPLPRITSRERNSKQSIFFSWSWLSRRGAFDSFLFCLLRYACFWPELSITGVLSLIVSSLARLLRVLTWNLDRRFGSVRSESLLQSKMLLSLFCPWLLLTQIWRIPPSQFLFLFCHWMILILFSRMLPPKFCFPVQLEQFPLVLVCHWLFLGPHLRISLFCFQIVRILLYMDFHWCFLVQIYCLRGWLFLWMILVPLRVLSPLCVNFLAKPFWKKLA